MFFIQWISKDRLVHPLKILTFPKKCKNAMTGEQILLKPHGNINKGKHDMRAKDSALPFRSVLPWPQYSFCINGLQIHKSMQFSLLLL